MGEDMNLDPVGELMRSVAPTSDIPLLDEKQLKHVEVTARTLSSRRARHRSTVRFGALGLGLVASALAVATLAADGGSSLPSPTPLTLTSMHPASVASAPAVIARESIRVLALGLTSKGSGSAIVYRVSSPTDAAAFAQQLATDFSVPGDLTVSTAAGFPQYQIQSSDVSGDGYVSAWEQSGILNWTVEGGLSNPISPSEFGFGGQAVSGTPTDSQAESEAVAFLNDIGITSASLGTPVVNYGGQLTANNQVYVDIPLEESGMPTGLSYEIIFGKGGDLLSAQGTSVTLTARAVYPLESPGKAVAAVRGAMGSSYLTQVTGAGGFSGGSSSTNGKSQDSISVHLRQATLGLAPFVLQNGEGVLVPVWRMTGWDQTSSSGRHRVTATVIAIQRRFLKRA